MNNITYIEVWKLWFAGESTNQFYLWGLSILWWGRIGKVVGLLAGLVVISEIIGSGNLLRLSIELQTTIDITTTVTALKNQWNSTISDMKGRDIISPFYGRLINFVFKANKYKTLKVSGFLLLIITIVYLISATTWLGYYMLLLVLSNFLGNFLWKIVVPILVLLYKLVIAIPVFAVDNFIKNIAYLLAFLANDRKAKAFSVVLLILGFHFDLLAS
ncbi:MAG: hypothetical protein Q8L41_10760 [Anaerolineales bacterium]|nr:hypothetical protein [Anaerolineales bacterium]